MIKSLILDFDGVITESVGIKAEAFSNLYKKYGNDIQRKILDHHYSNGGMSRYDKFRFYHEEFLGITLTDSMMKNLSNRFSKIVLGKIINVPYVNGALDFLNLYYNTYNLFISTGTPKTEIDLIIKERKIDHYFLKVYGSPMSKVTHVHQILSKFNLKREETIFVGDSLEDFNAAKSTGLKFVARIHDTNEYLNGSNNCINDLTELPELLILFHK